MLTIDRIEELAADDDDMEPMTNGEWEELLAAAKRDADVRTLDEWARPEGDGLSWETENDNDEERWACVLKGYDVVPYLGSTPSEARHAAASAVRGPAR